MKRLLPLLFLLCSLFAQAQNTKAKATTPVIRQSPGLEGLGKFKIGKTGLSIIDDLAKELGTEVVKAASVTDIYLNSSATLFQILPDSLDPHAAHQESTWCKEARVFYMPKYTVAEIELTEVYLYFYKGVLSKIQTEYNTELAAAFVSKYGKPNHVVNSKPVGCVYKLTGRSTNYKEITSSETWYNSTIVAVSYLSNYYDSDCKQQFVSYFRIYDKPRHAAALTCGIAELKVKSAAEQAAKKKRLSDL